MKLNRKAIPIIGTLLLVTAFMHTTNEASSDGNSIGFEVLAEGPTTQTGNSVQDLPGTASADWQGKGRVAITTVGHENCPVLPVSVTLSEGVAWIDLTVVARELTCGPTMESYTTLIRLDGLDEDQDLRLEIRDDEGI